MALNLNKLFVRVQQSAFTSIDAIITASNANEKKVYFVEPTNQIVVNGIVYGVDPTTVSSITDLQNLIGASSITDAAALSQTVIERLRHLESIQIATDDDSDDYLSITTDSSVPTLHANVIDIATATEGDTGLVDAVEAKGYIDEKVAEATTEVVEGKGIKVTESTVTNDGHAIYTIDSSLSLEYVAAVTEGTPKNAHIKLTDGNGNSFGEINVSDIIGNGILKGSSYNPATGILTLTFAEADGTPSTIDINLRDMLDLGDLMVKANSTDYLQISTVDSSTDVNQAQFEIKIADVENAANGSTGLVDAYNVKQYIASQTTNLAVTAQGDNYVDASVLDNDNKNVRVAANVQTLTGTKGTAGTYNAEGTQTAAPSHGTLSGTANSLVDAADVATKVKDYVDGEVAIEAARSDAYTDAKVAALDADISTKGTNVSVGVTEVDGKITAVNVTETYATITYANDTWTNTNPTGLVTGNDMKTMKSYVDDQIGDSSISAQGDGKYIDASVDVNNNKKINVKANKEDLSYTAGDSTTNATLTGTANTLVDGGQAATAISLFTNHRIEQEVAKLDSTVNLTDSSSYVSTTIAETDGKLTSTGSSLSVQYGTMGVSSTNGIAKAEDVQTFVDTYDFWETYSA